MARGAVLLLLSVQDRIELTGAPLSRNPHTITR